ncbi:MAG TPA: hypothetical protein VF812_02965 [Ktedonobacterales bacterium]
MSSRGAASDRAKEFAAPQDKYLTTRQVWSLGYTGGILAAWAPR